MPSSSSSPTSSFILLLTITIFFSLFAQSVHGAEKGCLLNPIELKPFEVLTVYSSNNVTYFKATVYDPNNAYLQFRVSTVTPYTAPIVVSSILDDCSPSYDDVAFGFGVVRFNILDASVGVYTVAVTTELNNYYIQACVDGCPFVCPGDCSASGFCDQMTGVCTCIGGWKGDSCSTPADYDPTPTPTDASTSPNEAARSFITSFIISFLAMFSLLVFFRCLRSCRRPGPTRTQVQYTRLPQAEREEPKKIIEEPKQTQELQKMQTSIPIPPQNTVWTINEAQTPQGNQATTPVFLYPQTQVQQPYFFYPTQQQYFAYPAAIPAYTRVPNSPSN